MRAGGELYSNTVTTRAAPDPAPSDSTEYGIKAWRVGTAQRFIVEWRLEQPCPANTHFYLRFDSTPGPGPNMPAIGASWRTPGRGRHGRQLFVDSEPDEVYIFCATSDRDPNFGHIYATADIADIAAEPVLGPRTGHPDRIGSRARKPVAPDRGPVGAGAVILYNQTTQQLCPARSFIAYDHYN